MFSAQLRAGKGERQSFEKQNFYMNSQHIFVSGGGERDRTDDPLLAKQVLSQLSYTPETVVGGGSGWIRTNDPRLIKTVL